MTPQEKVIAMRILKMVAIVGLLAASACGSGSDTSSTVDTTSAPVVTTTDAPAETTPATEPAATEPAATEPPVTAPAVTEPAATEPPATTDVVELVDVKNYVLREERLAIVHRAVEGPAVLEAALTELLAGPTDDERAAGLGTEVPAGTPLLGVALADGTARVDLGSQFESGGGSLSMTARVAQVVFTATQFDNVDQVLFMLDGAPAEFLGGEGVVVSEPLTRSGVDRAFTGGIIIDTPTPGSEVDNPFTVTGEGDVFEGDFPIEVWADGEQIVVVAPVTAGAWGDWAEFEVSITLDAPSGPIELIAYDEGGCGDDPDCPPIIETIVPLTFVAGS